MAVSHLINLTYNLLKALQPTAPSGTHLIVIFCVMNFLGIGYKVDKASDLHCVQNASRHNRIKLHIYQSLFSALIFWPAKCHLVSYISLPEPSGGVNESVIYQINKVGGQKSY